MNFFKKTPIKKYTEVICKSITINLDMLQSENSSPIQFPNYIGECKNSITPHLDIVQIQNSFVVPNDIQQHLVMKTSAD